MKLRKPIGLSLVQTAFGLALGLSTSSPARAQIPGPDIFIGTLVTEQGQVFLDRCAIGDPRYGRRDDPRAAGLRRLRP